MSKVALIKCENYNIDEVYRAIQRGIELIGGLDSLFGQDDLLLLKPNMLAADPPEKCSTTHPVVFEAIAKILTEAKHTVSYGDSPAFHTPLTAAKKTGIHAVATRYNIPLADFIKGEDVFYEGAIQNKKLFIAKGVESADAVISLPKLKTHGFQKMTGSIKNQFGCVPGKLKGEMHVKLPSALDFSKMLVDLNHYISPKLYIMDGILAMEGNGPRGGHPKKMNVLLISTDGVALDATVCRMIQLDPELVPTTKIGQEVGMGYYEEDKIDLVGDPIEAFSTPIFDVDRDPIRSFKQGSLAKLINKIAVPKPFIEEKKCVQCGVCVLMCPVESKAVNWDHGDKTTAPIYDYSKCIRCYCCQELCPESAIELDVPLLRKVVDKRFK